MSLDRTPPRSHCVCGRRPGQREMGAAGRGVRVAGGSHVVAAAGAALCVVGDVTTPAYQAARRLADALAERRLVGAATGRGLLPQDYDEFAAAKRRELWAASDGEDAAPLLHKGRVLCWEGRLIGDGGALAAWARDEFGVEDRTHRSAYRYLAAKALRTQCVAAARVRARARCRASSHPLDCRSLTPLTPPTPAHAHARARAHTHTHTA